MKDKEVKEKVSKMSFRIDFDLRKDFIDICKNMETDASKELRKFVKTFVSKNRTDMRD